MKKKCLCEIVRTHFFQTQTDIDIFDSWTVLPTPLLGTQLGTHCGGDRVRIGRGTEENLCM
jgi:hypothetical protein